MNEIREEFLPDACFTGQQSRSVILRDDKGRGLRSKRLGLTSMRERAESIGAKLRIDSAPGEGTTVTVEVPLG